MRCWPPRAAASDRCYDFRMTRRTVLVVAGMTALAGCGTLLAPPWGVQEGELRPCGELRGCVSSQADDAAQRVEPLVYQTGRLDAREDLLKVIRGFRDAQVVSSNPSYIRVEFASRETVASGPTVLMIDIAEFYFPIDAAQVEVRSTPRRNMPDSGENRNRIEVIRERFSELQKHHPIP